MDCRSRIFTDPFFSYVSVDLVDKMIKGKANTAHCLRFPGDWYGSNFYYQIKFITVG